MARIAVDDLEVAWAGGLFEGEGSIHYRVADRRNSVRITLCVSSTDRDVIERFGRAVRHSHVTTLGRKTVVGKTVYRWQTQSTERVRETLELLMPYLGERRTQRAKEALKARDEYEKTMPQRYREGAYQQHRTKRSQCAPA